MLLSHRLHLTLTFPRIVITTEEGWIVVVNSLKWSSLQHGQMRSPLSSRPLHKQVMQTNLLQMVNCTSLSSSLEHSWHSRSLVDTEALSDCVATHECEAGEQKNWKELWTGCDRDGSSSTDGGWATNILFSFRSSPSTCSLKVFTNSTLVRWMGSPGKQFNTGDCTALHFPLPSLTASVHCNSHDTMIEGGCLDCHH